MSTPPVAAIPVPAPVQVKKATPAAAVLMASALSLLFFGYESSRAASISLLSANEVGLGSEALPFTVALGSPAGALVLYLYASSIKKNGARYTLRVSNMACVGVLSLMAIFSGYVMRAGGLGGKCLVIFFYVFREIYISLLSTQHWSFLASILDSSSTGVLVSSAGIVSISSAVGSCAVEWFVSFGGVLGLLFVSFVCTFLSWTCAEMAYAMGTSDNSHAKSSNPSHRLERQRPTTVWKDSWELILSHNTLKLLFLEALLHQGCSNMLNLMFHDGLRRGVTDDSRRAALVGRFFATVNISACLLQCLVMPKVLSHKTLPMFLRMIPFIVFCATALGFVDQSLLSVMLGFGSMKVLEYSVLTSAMELIYMPMGHEVRYLGKELIRFFGHRLGKSGTSLLLSAASAHFRPSLPTQTIWSSTLAAIWGASMYLLSSHLATKATQNLINLSDAATLAAAATAAQAQTLAQTDAVAGAGGVLRGGSEMQKQRLRARTGSSVWSQGSEDREDTTSEESGGEFEVDCDFDQTFYYKAPNSGHDLQVFDALSASGVRQPRTQITLSPGSGALGGGLRRRRRNTGDMGERSLTPPPPVNSSTTLFDANVFDDTGFYLSKAKGSGVSISSWATQSSREDEVEQEPDRPLGMVRVGSNHVSLNYLAALQRESDRRISTDESSEGW